MNSIFFLKDDCIWINKPNRMMMIHRYDHQIHFGEQHNLGVEHSPSTRKKKTEHINLKYNDQEY